MTNRIFNFSAGPAMLPTSVLEKARSEMMSFRGSGMSIMEISHRSELFESVLEAAEKGVRNALSVPLSHKVLFLQGGASLQFSMIPMNFLSKGRSADYVLTGTWGEKARVEADRCGRVNVIYSGEEDGYRAVPDEHALSFSDDAEYMHFTSNETIEGVQFSYEPDAGNTALICDASSDILSRPIDVTKYALIYAGAQKNIGPSGVTLVIIRDDMLDRVPQDQHSMLNYRKIAANGSMLNTPNTWGVYLISLVMEWLEEIGGVPAIEKINKQKSERLYAAIDGSDGFYTGHAERNARSNMNVTFRLPAAELDAAFCSEAARRGLDGLRGHRSVGGIRASIYNSFPIEGVEHLVEFMGEFSAANR